MITLTQAHELLTALELRLGARVKLGLDRGRLEVTVLGKGKSPRLQFSPGILAKLSNADLLDIIEKHWRETTTK